MTDLHIDCNTWMDMMNMNRLNPHLEPTERTTLRKRERKRERERRRLRVSVDTIWTRFVSFSDYFTVINFEKK